jgi:hypothetical protein
VIGRFGDFAFASRRQRTSAVPSRAVSGISLLMPAWVTGIGRQCEYAEAPRSRPWRAKALASDGGLLAWLRAGAAGHYVKTSVMRSFGAS